MILNLTQLYYLLSTHQTQQTKSEKRHLNLNFSRGISFIRGVMSMDWSLQLDHLKLCTGNIDIHLLEFDHIMITSPTHSLLRTDADIYRKADKVITKCNYYFGSLSLYPSILLSVSVGQSVCLSVCLSTWHYSNEQDWYVRKLTLRISMKICKCIPGLIKTGQK
jgi:hypothetical protein